MAGSGCFRYREPDLGRRAVSFAHFGAHQYVGKADIAASFASGIVITLGLFYLVVNTLMLYLAAWLANALFGIGFEIATFGSAFVAAIVISIVSVFLNGVIGADA